MNYQRFKSPAATSINVYLAGPIEKERLRWGLVDWNFPDTAKEPLHDVRLSMKAIALLVVGIHRIWCG